MQNADTTQFFWGDLVQYISTTTTTTQKQYLVQVAVEAVLRSISRFESILFLSYFYVISISDCCASKNFGREKRSEAGSIAITLLLLFPPSAASNCYSQERIEAVDQDSRVNFLKQPLATSKKQPRMSELSHSTTSAAAIKQRIHSSSVCCAVDVVQFVLMSFF